MFNNFFFGLIHKIQSLYIVFLNKNIFSRVNCEYDTLVIGPDYNKNFVIKFPNNLVIKNNVVLNGNCYINALGFVEIGKYSHLAKGLTIYSHNHNYEEATKIPYDNVVVKKTVIIKDFVWVGANVTILPGVTIGEGVVVAAGSVVVKDVPDFAVVGGNPAIVLKYRNKNKFLDNKAKGNFF